MSDLITFGEYLNAYPLMFGDFHLEHDTVKNPRDPVEVMRVAMKGLGVSGRLRANDEHSWFTTLNHDADRGVLYYFGLCLLGEGLYKSELQGKNRSNIASPHSLHDRTSLDAFRYCRQNSAADRDRRN